MLVVVEMKIDKANFMLDAYANFKIKSYLITLVTTTTMTTRIEGHTRISGPERFVHSGEVKIHARERFDSVMVRFDSQVSHSAQPEVHSLRTPLSIFTEEAAVAPE